MSFRRLKSTDQSEGNDYLIKFIKCLFDVPSTIVVIQPFNGILTKPKKILGSTDNPMTIKQKTDICTIHSSDDKIFKNLSFVAMLW
ncbi:hypothetical protein M153_2810005142 [Pseudoloma neurophilia]|uniref:Uncharacterized protein n=1 Tax=Pseudoloma neurophilia TaxID=146866 RepID=A0A0R0M453_9MICR|nr:hypothetical protein M153_2810005142 [Pseudoloma neurophilia]